MMFGFVLELYDYWGTMLDQKGIFYINGNSILNSYNKNDIIDTNFGNLDTSSFEDIIKFSQGFLALFLGFFAIFPTWLNTLIALGVTVAIACRIFGR